MTRSASWSFMALVLFIFTITSCGGGDQGGLGGVNNPCFTIEGCTTDKACAQDSDCDDNEPCTEDRCDTAIAACRYSGLDQDNDGYVVQSCGGDDCDDSPGLFGIDCNCPSRYDCDPPESWPPCGFFHNPGLPETCDGMDNDCDEDVDEEEDLLPELCGNLDFGECKPGMTAGCVNGEWTQCVGEISPTNELCDGLDNDCDGLVDNNVDQDGDGDYAACSGGGDCDDLNPLIGPSAYELCNGMDDTCNGIIDVCNSGGLWSVLFTDGDLSDEDETWDITQSDDCPGILTGTVTSGPRSSWSCTGEQGEYSFNWTCNEPPAILPKLEIVNGVVTLFEDKRCQRIIGNYSYSENYSSWGSFVAIRN